VNSVLDRKENAKHSNICHNMTALMLCVCVWMSDDAPLGLEPIGGDGRVGYPRTPKPPWSRDSGLEQDEDWKKYR
jgi:hypothetical protein